MHAVIEIFRFFLKGKQVFLVINISDYEHSFKVMADSLS